MAAPPALVQPTARERQRSAIAKAGLLVQQQRQGDGNMKKLLIIAALLMATSTAYAGDRSCLATVVVGPEWTTVGDYCRFKTASKLGSAFYKYVQMVRNVLSVWHSMISVEIIAQITNSS
jgi:hypothetical protein